MRKIVLALVVLTSTAAIVAPPAAAEQLHANAASASPNDVQPGEPQTVVFYLYTPSPKPWSPDGKRFAGVNDVQVVLHGQGQTRRFAATDLGDGRYSAQITFPEDGSWSVRVSYGSGLYGAGDEIALGKGGIRVPAQPVEQSAASSKGRPWTTIGVIVAAVLALGLVAAVVIRSTPIGRRRRVAPTL
jgi:hypothetical protein